MRKSRVRNQQQSSFGRLLHSFGFDSVTKGKLRTGLKKSVASIISLMLVLQAALVTGIMHTLAAPIDNNSQIVKQVLLMKGQGHEQSAIEGCFASPEGCGSVTAAVKNEGGSLVSYSDTFETTLGATDYPFTLAYEWVITEEQAAEGGTYTFTLPDALIIQTDIQDEPIGPAGTFSVDKNTKQVTVNFVAQPGPAENYHLKGGLVVAAWLDETIEIVNNEIVMNIPISQTGNLDVRIPVEFQGSSPNVDKRLDISKGVGGVDRTVNTSEIYWVIDVNTALSSIGQAVVKDILPDDLELVEDSVKVHSLNVSLNGAVTEGGEVAGFTADTSTPGQFSLDLGSDIKSAYRIKFTTKVKSDAVISETPKELINNVQLLDGSEIKDSSSAEISVQRGQLLRKEYNEGSYDPVNGHLVTWTVLFNFGETQHNSPKLTDTLPQGQELVPGSVTVEAVEVSATGQPGAKKADVLEGAGQGTFALTSGTGTFDLTLNGTVSDAYKIVYQTRAKADSPITNNFTSSNKIEYMGEGPGVTFNYTHRVISKTGSIIDFANKKIRWSMTLNENGYRFKGTADNKLRLTDTFTNRGLAFDPGSMVITPKGGAALTEGVHYTVVSTKDSGDPSIESGFIIEFANSYDFNKEHTITYTTTYDYDLYTAPWNPNSNYTFTNRGDFAWQEIVNSLGTTKIGGSGSQSAESTVEPTGSNRYNGYKTGVYDAHTKTIEWNVLINYHNESVQNAVVTDVLVSGQKLLGSVTVKRMNISADAQGNLTEAATLVKDDPNGYTVIYDESGADPVLTVDFNSENISGPHLITFTTSLEGELVPSTIENTAEFTSDNGYHATLNTNVSVKFGNEFIVKSFKQNASAMRLAEWTMWVNRSLSRLDNVIIEDRPDEFQTLVPDSFKLYKAVPNVENPSQDSHFTLTEADPDDYEVTVSIDPATNREMFTLELFGSIETAYRLTYETLLAKGVNTVTSNEYKLQADQKQVTSTPSQHRFNVNKNSASGFTFPDNAKYKGSVKLLKQPAENPTLTLQGAEFKIAAKYGDFTAIGVTDEHGIVSFNDLPFDQYELVEVKAPNGYLLDPTKHNIILNATGQKEIVLSNKRSSQLGNYVWLDRDRDGIQDADESGINGVTVKLYKAGETTPIRTTTTANKSTGAGDVPGYYLFDELEPGDYVVEFQWPYDYELTKEVAGSPDTDSNPLDDDNKTNIITLDSSNDFTDWTIDLGLVAKGEIGNYVWLDRDRDGLQDAEETGLNNIEVILFKETGGVRTEVARTTTANHPATNTPGYYLFDHLVSGDYYVQFNVPVSYEVTTAEAGSNDEQDSNATDPAGVTDKIFIGPGSWIDHSIDLGVQGKGKIGDYVWFDTNDNGVQDSDEDGIAEIEVRLYKENGTGTRELIETQKTDSNGWYLFDHLEQGDYYVWFQTPSIYKLAKSESAAATPATDSNKIHEAGSDQGFTVNKITIGGLQPWEDLTIDLGFTGKGAIGNYVWHDRNRDGIQNEGAEHGINGVTVSLYKGSPAGTPFRTDVTKTENGQPGYYSFTELPEGTYYVKFDYPEQYETTIAETDDDAENGSNALNASNTTGAIVIGENASPFGWVNPSIDLGLVAKGSIGNYVWLDRNRNGIQDEAAEEGLNGITVKLYKDSASGTAYAETVTADGPDGKPGYYLFDNLASGDYYVQIMLDASHEVTLANQGSGDQADGSDSNGVNAQGFTSVIPIAENGPKGWNDLTIDFGIVGKGSIGDYVWFDSNTNGKQDENGDAGFDGVTVKLYDSNKTLIAETKTATKDGKKGYYLFDHLVEGDYYVQFDTPAGYITTKAGADGVQPNEDSNPVFNGFTEIIPIGPGTTWSDMTIDQGYYFIPFIPGPAPTPTPTPEPEESVPPGETEEPGSTPSPTPTPAPTPTPGGSPKPTVPAPTPITETTKEETPVKGEVDVPKGGDTKIGTPPANGNVTVTPDGKWVYTPKPGYTGKDRFSVIVRNENNEEEELWFEIDVDPIPKGTVDVTPDIDNLPKTGQTDYTLLYLLGAALIGGGVLLRLYGKRRTR